jgi:DDE superfamily endonuclease
VWTNYPSRLSDGRALIDATEQRISRSIDPATRDEHYSGKRKAFTLKTQLVTDGQHHIQAISVAVPGRVHDKTLAEQVDTIQRLPDGIEALLDKGYQGLAQQVDVVLNETGAPVPALTWKIPYKKPKGKDLSAQQKVFNHDLSAVRVHIEHCIGWLKNWAILANRFRCAHAIYTAVFQLVCGLVNAQTYLWQSCLSYCA